MKAFNPHAELATRKLRAAEAILTAASAETRDLSPDEQRSYDDLLGQADAEAKRAATYRSIDEVLASYPVAPPRGGGRQTPAMTEPPAAGETRALVPSWSEYRDGQATTPDADGGYLVPLPIEQVVDRLRPQSVFLAAQPFVIEMESSSLSIPKIGTGIVADWYLENAEIDDSKIVFDRVLLTARKLAGIGLASNEWLADAAPTAGRAVVEQNLLDELGTALDFAAFNGDGLDGMPTGLLHVPGVTKTPIGAGLTLDAVAASLARVEAESAVPTAVFMHPLAYAALRTERESGSTTGIYQLSADPSAAAPRTLWGVPVFLSTHLGTNVVVADMTRVAFGIRQHVSLFYDPYSASKKDQVLIRATLRADLAPLHDRAVDVLTGVTIDGGAAPEGDPPARRRRSAAPQTAVNA